MKQRRSVAGLTVTALVTALCLIFPGGSKGQGYSEGRRFTKFERVAGLTGEALEVILAAVPEAERNRLVVKQSMIVLYDVGDYYVVVFSDRDRWADTEGRERKESEWLRFGGSDILEVEVSKDGKRKARAIRVWRSK